MSELKARLERLALTKMEHMRLVFNGFTLTATNSLADYDIQGGDSLYLYTVKDPNETTVVCCTTDELTHTKQIDRGCGSGCGTCSGFCCGAPVVGAGGGVCAPQCCASTRHQVPPHICGAPAATAISGCCCPCGRCTVSQTVLAKPYACHIQRCLCGSCVATSVSPINRRCNEAAAHMT